MGTSCPLKGAACHLEGQCAFGDGRMLFVGQRAVVDEASVCSTAAVVRM